MAADPATTSPAAQPTTVDAAAVLMLEYETVKKEQAQRVGFRDNFIYVTLAACAAVITAMQHLTAHAELLLLLPPVCVILGWTYLVNDQKVSAIAGYVRGQIAPRLTALAGEPVLGWETDHRADRRRRQRKHLQLVIDLTTFCVPAFAAVALFWTSSRPTPALLAVSIVEGMATGGLAWQITVYAELATGPEQQPRADAACPAPKEAHHGTR